MLVLRIIDLTMLKEGINGAVMIKECEMWDDWKFVEERVGVGG